AVTRMVAEGGRTHADGSSVIVEAANAVTILIAAATTMRQRDPAQAAHDVLSGIAPVTYQTLRDRHVSDYRKLASRARLDLEAVAPDLPTNERLARVKAGTADPALEALYFTFGRYLLISSSRPGGLPANLQG